MERYNFFRNRITDVNFEFHSKKCKFTVDIYKNSNQMYCLVVYFYVDNNLIMYYKYFLDHRFIALGSLNFIENATIRDFKREVLNYLLNGKTTKFF